jgi:hypothetical protein
MIHWSAHTESLPPSSGFKFGWPHQESTHTKEMSPPLHARHRLWASIAAARGYTRGIVVADAIEQSSFAHSNRFSVPIMQSSSKPPPWAELLSLEFAACGLPRVIHLELHAKLVLRAYRYPIDSTSVNCCYERIVVLDVVERKRGLEDSFPNNLIECRTAFSR